MCPDMLTRCVIETGYVSTGIFYYRLHTIVCVYVIFAFHMFAFGVSEQVLYDILRISNQQPHSNVN